MSEMSSPEGSPRRLQTTRGFDAVATLGALRTAIVLVDADDTVSYMNPASERLLRATARRQLGLGVDALLPGWSRSRGPALCHRVRANGSQESFQIESVDESGSRLLDVHLSRGPGNAVLLEIHGVDRDEQSAISAGWESRDDSSFRSLARELAGEADSSRLFAMICEAARSQCRAHGSAVLRVQDGEGLIVGTCGAHQWPLGAPVELRGSLAERVISARSTVMEADYMGTYTRTRRFPAGFEIGAAAASPLIAHDEVLGVVVVWRVRDAAPFGPSDRDRLDAIADYAALVLWKSLLLERVQEANLSKANFLATVSHELRTPLTALTGYGELLADEVLGSLRAEQLEVVERMRSVTHHLGVVIDEILSFSNLEAGRERANVRDTDAAELVRNAIAVIAPLADQKHIELRPELPAEPAAIRTDPDRARQILVNLIGNGVKFTEEGRVTVSVRGSESEFRFEVADTGIGIAREDLPRLFQPFTQLDGTLTRRHGGTGLGLYISQRLAALLGGRVECESQEGKGSTFTLVLPGQPGRSA